MTSEEKQGNRLAYLGALAGGLAHEIKNPLSTISMNLQLLKEDWADPETDRERRTVRKIAVLSREVERLEAILDDFLRFAGERKLHKVPLSLNGLIEEVLEFLGPRLLAAGVGARTMFDPTLPDLMMDRDALKQVFLNLFLNAMQAMAGGGELMVRTLRFGSRILVEVTDTGEGIPPEILERIWQVYYSRRKTGTGMGLPTARRFVEEHDGEISVVSEVGKGTRFTLSFPAPRELPPPRHDGAGTARGGGES